MRITVIYDNGPAEGLRSGWGFSALVEAHGKTILFDTGDDGDALLSNLKSLGIDIEGIDCVFISHGDWDHVGGLAAFLEERGPLPVFVPSSASGGLGRRLGGKAQIMPVSGAREIYPGCFTTGELDGVEQSLVVSGDRGSMVICGCSHPGLDRILETAKGFGKVYGVIGGFHGSDKLEALKGLGLVAPCHCTERKSEIALSFPDIFLGCRTGTVVSF